MPVPAKVYAIEYSPASKNEPYHCCWLPGCHQNYGVLPEPVTRESVLATFLNAATDGHPEQAKHIGPLREGLWLVVHRDPPPGEKTVGDARK